MDDKFNIPALSDPARKMLYLVLKNAKALEVDWDKVAAQGQYKSASSAAGTWAYYKRNMFAAAEAGGGGPRGPATVTPRKRKAPPANKASPTTKGGSGRGRGRGDDDDNDDTEEDNSNGGRGASPAMAKAKRQKAASNANAAAASDSTAVKAEPRDDDGTRGLVDWPLVG